MTSDSCWKLSFSIKYLWAALALALVSSASLGFRWDTGGWRCGDTSNSQLQVQQQANQDHH